MNNKQDITSKKLKNTQKNFSSKFKSSLDIYTMVPYCIIPTN